MQTDISSSTYYIFHLDYTVSQMNFVYLSFPVKNQKEIYTFNDFYERKTFKTGFIE